MAGVTSPVSSSRLTTTSGCMDPFDESAKDEDDPKETSPAPESLSSVLPSPATPESRGSRGLNLRERRTLGPDGGLESLENETSGPDEACRQGEGEETRGSDGIRGNSPGDAWFSEFARCAGVVERRNGEKRAVLYAGEPNSGEDVRRRVVPKAECWMLDRCGSRMSRRESLVMDSAPSNSRHSCDRSGV